MEEKAKLEAICSSIFDGIYTVDREKKILSFSPGAEAFTGFKEEEVLGKLCKDLLRHEDERANFLCSTECLLDEVLESGQKTTPRKVFIKTSTGLRKEVLTSACPIKNDIGEILGAAVFFREATNELKIEQLKSDFLSVVSHELRIPLATIKESISLLSDGITGQVNENQKNVLSSIKGQIERLTGLVESLLDVSSIESGRFRVRRRKLDLREIINQLQRFFQPTADKKSIKLLVSLAQDLEPIIGDPDRVTQVLSNLLNNAFRFTEAGGQVTISAKAKDKSFVECSVQDTGSGISSEMLDKLFEKFEQLGLEESKRRGGAGLGLAISKRIVEDLGGTIWAESKEAEGSKFSFTLLIYSEELELQLELEASIKEARQRQVTVALLELETEAKVPEFESLFEMIHHTIRGPNDKAIKHKNYIFLILHSADKTGAMSVKQRIHDKISKQGAPGALLVRRFGIAVYPDEGLTYKELLERAQSNLAPF